MKFSGKICLMIILKVTKNQSFSFSLEDTVKLENKEIHVEQFNGKHSHIQICKWREDLAIFLLLINKETKHRRKEMIL